MAAVRFGEVRSDLRITYAGFEVQAGASHARIAVQTARLLASVVGNPPCAKADLTAIQHLFTVLVRYKKKGFPEVQS